MQTLCGTLSSWHVGHSTNVGATTLKFDEFLEFLLAFETLRFGTAVFLPPNFLLNLARPLYHKKPFCQLIFYNYEIKLMVSLAITSSSFVGIL